MTESQGKDWSLADIIRDAPTRKDISMSEWLAANYRVSVLEQELLQERKEHAQCCERVAKLEAEKVANAWRPIDDLDITQDVEAEIVLRATYQHEYGTWDAREINILLHDADYWRPV